MKRLKYGLIMIALPMAILVCSLTSTHLMMAQDVIPINLEIVLELGGADNLTIKEYQEQQRLSLADVTKAKEWWLPEIYAGAQSQQLWGAAQNSDGRFFLGVNRQSLWSGLGFNVNWDFADAKYDLESAKLKSRVSQFLTLKERNQQLLHIINVYYELMTAQLNYDAYQNLVIQSDNIIQQIQIQVEVGLLYQSELLLAKSNKNHLQVEMLSAKKEYNVASAALKKLLNIEQGVKLALIDKSFIPLEFDAEVVAVDDFSYLNRPEIKANELQLKVLETERQRKTKGILIPELNIGTYGSFFGRITGKVSPVDPILNPNPNQLYPTGAFNVSLLWKVPLGEFTYQGDKEAFSSEIRLNEIAAEQFEVQINEEIANANSDLQLGREQIATSKEALDFTMEALNQGMERQKIGTAKPFEVFQAQQFFLQAQLDYLKAVGDHNKAHYALKVAKGDTL